MIGAESQSEPATAAPPRRKIVNRRQVRRSRRTGLFVAWWVVLAFGMIAILAPMAWLINLSALVVDLVPKQCLASVFGIVAAGSSLGGIFGTRASDGSLRRIRMRRRFTSC
jgi:hypothetical protein